MMLLLLPRTIKRLWRVQVQDSKGKGTRRAGIHSTGCVVVKR